MTKNKALSIIRKELKTLKVFKECKVVMDECYNHDEVLEVVVIVDDHIVDKYRNYPLIREAVKHICDKTNVAEIFSLIIPVVSKTQYSRQKK